MKRRPFSPSLAIAGTLCLLIAMPALTGVDVWGGLGLLALPALGLMIVALTVRSWKRSTRVTVGNDHTSEDPALIEARAEVERIDPLSPATWDGL